MPVVMSINEVVGTEAPGGVVVPVPSTASAIGSAVQTPALAEEMPQVALIQRNDLRRHQVEQFIATGFAATYQAELRQFMPQLLAVTARNQLQAALGVRSGQTEKLFVEQYLDADIRFVLRDIGVLTAREHIVEIGNLYAANRHYTLLLFVVTAYALHQAGFRHLVCCATPQVQNLLSRHGLQLHTLAKGDPARLSGDAAAWGTYYQSHPMVCYLDLNQALNLIQSESRLDLLTKQFWPSSQPSLNGQAQEN